MKRLAVAVILSTFLAACGSDDSGPAVSPVELGGLWDTNNISIENVSIPVPSGEMYLLVENADQNPIAVTLYVLGDQNCFEGEPGELTYVGNYRYRDESGDEARLELNGENLLMRLQDEQVTMNINMERASGISATDLPVCTTQSDNTDNLLFNDSTVDAPIETFFNTIYENSLSR